MKRERDQFQMERDQLMTERDQLLKRIAEFNVRLKQLESEKKELEVILQVENSLILYSERDTLEAGIAFFTEEGEC